MDPPPESGNGDIVTGWSWMQQLSLFVLKAIWLYAYDNDLGEFHILVSGFSRYHRFVALHAISPPHDRPGRPCMNVFAWTCLSRLYCNIKYLKKTKPTKKQKQYKRKEELLILI